MWTILLPLEEYSRRKLHGRFSSPCDWRSDETHDYSVLRNLTSAVRSSAFKSSPNGCPFTACAGVAAPQFEDRNSGFSLAGSNSSSIEPIEPSCRKQASIQIVRSDGTR